MRVAQTLIGRVSLLKDEITPDGSAQIDA